MHKLYVFVLGVVMMLASLSFVQSCYAISPNVVISQIKAANSSASRLVEIYNNSVTPVDITGWCLFYSSPSNTSPYTSLGCFESSNTSVHVFINASSFALLASSQTVLKADMELVAGLGSGTSGHVYLRDGAGNEIDRVGWGSSATNAESKPIVLDSTKVIERKRDIITNLLIDTDNNENDFRVSVLRTTYQYGAIYEVVDACKNIAGVQEIMPVDYTVDEGGNCIPPPVDICSNLDGLQVLIPDGFALDINGNCIVDICKNIDGLQQSLPAGMDLDDSGNCVTHDECSNLPEIQTMILGGYKRGNENNCILDLLPLKITEVLPNPIGNDDGNEFIELYNPNDSDINLSDYILYVGSNNVEYNFPDNSHVKAGEYLAFSNNDIKFTLINTSSSVALRSADDTLIDEIPIYSNLGEGMAWVEINDVWQYTNRPTPGSANLASLIELDDVSSLISNLAPCVANQYRSPETNRCRLIASSTSTLAICKDNQYRSEETNRCRNISSSTSDLAQCAEGQERNPATNRCRSITSVLGASDLVPCKAGQERNPETNRCRNVASAMPKAEYAPEQTNESANDYILWWSLAAVGMVAIIYGIWEWRHEIVNLIKKAKLILKK